MPPLPPATVVRELLGLAELFGSFVQAASEASAKLEPAARAAGGGNLLLGLAGDAPSPQRGATEALRPLVKAQFKVARELLDQAKPVLAELEELHRVGQPLPPALAFQVGVLLGRADATISQLQALDPLLLPDAARVVAERREPLARAGAALAQAAAGLFADPAPRPGRRRG